ncbi:TonB-linked outer membrane protein, SusC/RagA family [Pedobacter xixiisoli]|uniref:TonB-linked outer membrane protein, SusC/RagA family n=1 Tax=Pedobacter xixiisoli TaxID=1476464 RepID=A0A285ZQV5_9SPHI|nr:SusC/RagA family TonB-linked outer membrane protein [Pedobacter xixiisoli]SOD12019.1 TonB-linked outer membrane protein, SusC/RagA family [Pedobacter xixiisoli]
MNKLLSKLSTFFLVLVCFYFPSWANANSLQKIDLNAQNKSLKTIIESLEKQSNYYFIYDNELLNSNKNLSVNFDNLTFEETVKLLSSKINVNYKIVDKTVTLYSKNSSVPQQEVTITGFVKLKNKDNNIPFPVNGVSVLVKGTNRGTTTDFKGQFSLKISGPVTLVISYLGYEKKEMAVNAATKIDLVLQELEGTLNEVVVSAYGIKESKENQIGSAYTVTAKDLEKRPALRIDALLEGLVPGLEFNIQDQNNGSARPRFSTRVRGESSAPYGVMSNEPLWILDGIPVNTGGTTNSIAGPETSISPLTYINPEDIESITVLKDASATAIYGSSGSNGVILVRTKKGNGTPIVKYTYRTTIDQIASYNTFNVLNGDQYRRVVNEMGLGDKIAGYGDVSTNWLDTYYEQGKVNTHNLSLSGSNESTNYYISGSFYDQQLTSLTNETKRYSLRSQINTDVSKRLSFNFVFGGSFNVNDMWSVGSNYYTELPVVSPYNPDGSYALYDYLENRLFPSLAEAYQNENGQSTLQAFSQIQATFRILPGLDFTTRSGVDFSSINELRYSSLQNLTGKQFNGYLYKNQARMYNWTSNATLNYTKQLYDGTLSALLGFEANNSNSSFIRASAFNFPNDYVRELSMAIAENTRSSGNTNETASLSNFGRLSYLWKDKYNVSVSFRRDGDSDFGEDVKWATFYALGAAWTVSNEEFWKNNVPKDINFLKFKLSYGTAGNGRFNGNYAKGLYTFSEGNGYGGVVGAIMSRGRNTGLKWETTYKFNTGIDFGLFNRINVGLEYYRDITHDLISDATVSLTTGQRSIYRNSGKLQNSGFEATISSTNIERGGFTWSTNFNLALNRNKVLSLPTDIGQSNLTSIMQVGGDSRALYLVRWAGVDPSTGDPMWYDANGNITKVYDLNNRVVMGRVTPNFYGGITNSFNYKGFNLSFLLLYSQGGSSLSELLNTAGHDGLNILSTNLSTDLLDHWRYPGDLSVNPRLTQVSTSSNRNSTRYLIDRSNIQLKNISLEYRLPDDFVKKGFLKRAAVYIMADNVAMWTPYRTSKRNNLGNGQYETIKLNTYANSFRGAPGQASYSAGVNLTF